uniref:heme o synthase n=1 Tax=Alicyclobacillus shizuokensis TaxID=392014 RepID=UPI0009F8BF93
MTSRVAADAGQIRALPGATERLRAYVELTKPRILALLLFTEFCAMVWAGQRWPEPRLALAALVGLALTAGGSAAVNMWYDRDIDGIMKRTANRPLPQGVVPARHALLLGLALGAAGVAWLGAMVNGLSALLAAAGYVYYAVVYTMGLKRSTPQNIVVGGGAGAFPPLVGWAAVTGHLDWPAWVMFGIVFLWTPSHFWGLALYRNGDYATAGIPMMPAVRGAKATIIQMIGYTCLLIAVSALPYAALSHPWPYEAVALACGAAFLAAHVMLWRTQTQPAQWARRTFLLSLVYLPVVFLALAAAALT